MIRYPKSLLLVVSLMLSLWLSGCGASILATPTVTPDARLTEIARSIDELRAELERVAPTLTALVEFIPETSLSATTVPVTATFTPTANQAVQENTPISTATALPTTPPEAVLETASPISPPAGSGVSNVMPSPTPVTAPGVLLFQDDFSSEIGWFVGENDRYRLELLGGGYRFLVNTTNSPIWSVRSLGVSDARLEVDAIQTSGPRDGYYGLVCRHQNDANYYLMVVSSDGNFGIGKVIDGEQRYLNFTTEYAEQLRPAGNRLRADCVGDKLSLFLNGEKVLEAVDDELTSGAVGVVVGNRSVPGTEVVFDNFVVLKP